MKKNTLRIGLIAALIVAIVVLLCCVSVKGNTEEVMAEGGVTLAAIVQDGRYENIVDGTPVEVIKGRICTDGRAVILRTQ